MTLPTARSRACRNWQSRRVLRLYEVRDWTVIIDDGVGRDASRKDMSKATERIR